MFIGLPLGDHILMIFLTFINPKLYDLHPLWNLKLGSCNPIYFVAEITKKCCIIDQLSNLECCTK